MLEFTTPIKASGNKPPTIKAYEYTLLGTYLLQLWDPGPEVNPPSAHCPLATEHPRRKGDAGGVCCHAALASRSFPAAHFQLLRWPSQPGLCSRGVATKIPSHSEQVFWVKCKEFQARQSITDTKVSCKMSLNILQHHLDILVRFKTDPWRVL